MAVRFPVLLVIAALAVPAFAAPAQAAGTSGAPPSQQQQPRGKPLDKIPYQYDEEAPPRLIGAIIGLGVVLAMVGGVAYAMRRKRLREQTARWRRALPPTDENSDPWLERDAVAEAKALVRDVDAAWAFDDEAALERLVAPKLLGRWRAVRAEWAHRRIDEYAPIRVDFVTALHPEDGEGARVVVRVEARVRELGDESPATVTGRLAARAGGKGSGERGMSPAEGHA